MITDALCLHVHTPRLVWESGHQICSHSTIVKLTLKYWFWCCAKWGFLLAVHWRCLRDSWLAQSLCFKSSFTFSILLGFLFCFGFCYCFKSQWHLLLWNPRSNQWGAPLPLQHRRLLPAPDGAISGWQSSIDQGENLFLWILGWCCGDVPGIRLRMAWNSCWCRLYLDCG